MVENREVNVSLATIEIPFIVLFLDQSGSVTGGTLATKGDESGTGFNVVNEIAKLRTCWAHKVSEISATFLENSLIAALLSPSS